MASAPELVLLTRSRHDNATLARLLRPLGLRLAAWPSPRAELLRSPGLAEAVSGADLVAFTSRRGVLAVRALLGRGGFRALGAARHGVAAVGAATAALLARLGVPARIVGPGDGGAEALGELVTRTLPRGARVALLRGEAAADAPVPAWIRAGLLVDDRRVYRLREPLGADVPRGVPAVVACASPSAARRVLLARPELRSAPFVAIGATTAAALRELGASSVTVAERPTPESMAGAIARAVASPVPAGRETP